MQAFLLLCDAANADVRGGKINMLGAGWSVTGPGPVATALVGFIRAPWDDVDWPLRFRLRLVDAAGNPVRLSKDREEQVSFTGEFAEPSDEPSDEMSKQLPFNFSFAVPIPPLPLQPGALFKWVFEFGGEEITSVEFAVRPEA
jgi:hypothetical protein